MPPSEQGRSLRSSSWRFLLAGGLNTLITGVLLSLLARVVDPRLAYSIVFVLGVAMSVALAGGFVFGVRMTQKLATHYVAMYLAVYLIGLMAVAIAFQAGMPREFSGLVVVVTAPLTFVGGRLILTRRAPSLRTSERNTQ